MNNNGRAVQTKKGGQKAAEREERECTRKSEPIRALMSRTYMRPTVVEKLVSRAQVGWVVLLRHATPCTIKTWLSPLGSALQSTSEMFKWGRLTPAKQPSSHGAGHELRDNTSKHLGWEAVPAARTESNCDSCRNGAAGRKQKAEVDR